MSTLFYSSLYLSVVLFGHTLSQPKSKAFLKVLLGFLSLVTVLIVFGPVLLSGGKNHFEGVLFVPMIEIGMCFFGGYLGGRVKDPTSGTGVAIAGFAGGLMVHFLFGRVLYVYGGQVIACESNMKNIGTGLEMYATDWGGAYPKDLGLLTPNYLMILPECPSAGEVTYKYSQGKDAPGNEVGNELYYFICCGGAHHKSVGRPPDYPRYDSVRGLEKGPGHKPSPWYQWYDVRHY